MKKHSLKQTKSLEDQVLKKPNKILRQKNLELICDDALIDSDDHVFFRRIKQDFDMQDQNQKYGWDTLHSVFFISTTGYANMFSWTRLVLKRPEILSELDVHICKSFRDLGLMNLEGSSSYEEILLKLNVMFPEV